MLPAFIVAGTHSGVGKTTVTLGLMAALRRRGMTVQPFKVGPDFIDPTHHTAICGRHSRNLDTFMMGADGVRRSFLSAIKGADVAVVEGVMGLYDGIGGGEEASTAHVAKVLGIPVVLVLNVHGMSRSAAALIHGFSSFDPAVNITGVILNQVGSERHMKALRESINFRIFGALPRRKSISLPSRHLGLAMGFEIAHDINALADLVEENVLLEELLDACKLEIAVPETEFGEGEEGGVRIAIALDEAFCFYYQDNIDRLRSAGAEIVPFSPIRDELPDVDGIYIGGGYPELHAASLESGRCIQQIRAAASDGMPIYGECGGLMYLGESLVIDDRRYKMAGILPATTLMTRHLQALGYVEGDVIRDNPVATEGSVIRGHEFHYSRVECDRDAKLAYRLRRGQGIANGMDGLVEHMTLGGYLHAHFASFPVERFMESCMTYKRR
ncbi:MAG: cobyrinate a,c-diamide synthase [Methanothrix sp.]|nr:cobyrinate a,c-diamide synthase [Methanothrix sp.]MCX8207093.1 cobyrinate a,c-diamide synthase [Methanothrix sp.]